MTEVYTPRRQPVDPEIFTKIAIFRDIIDTQVTYYGRFGGEPSRLFIAYT